MSYYPSMRNTTTATAAAKLTGRIAEMTSEQIHAAVNAIGGGHVEKHQRMVRAYLVEEIANREGVEAADLLMDQESFDRR